MLILGGMRMEDFYIVDLYWSRDESAIHETASKYGRYCYTIAYNILQNQDDADESVNDTYMIAWDRIPPSSIIFALKSFAAFPILSIIDRSRRILASVG